MTNPRKTIQRINAFYREFEPNFVEGERITFIETYQSGNHVYHKGTVAKIIVEWWSNLFGESVNQFYIGLDFGDGSRLFGVTFWDKIESLDNPPIEKFTYTKDKIQIPATHLKTNPPSGG